MSAWAQTNVQLYNQLSEAGYSRNDIERVHEAYGLAMELFPGAFRGSGRPFLSHLVGTASVLAWLRAPLAVVAGGLLHSAYSHGEFGNYWRGMAEDKRRRVRERVGEEIEELVAAYTRFPWNPAAIVRLADNLDGLDERGRRVLLMRLANELDDHEDLNVLYVKEAEIRRDLVRAPLPLCLGMAEHLGYPHLGEELARVFKATLETEVSPALRGVHDESFVLAPASHVWRPRVLARWGLARLLRLL